MSKGLGWATAAERRQKRGGMAIYRQKTDDAHGLKETFESEAKDWAVFTSSLIFASSLPSLYEFRLQ
jgi:hypothetical protein